MTPPDPDMYTTTLRELMDLMEAHDLPVPLSLTAVHYSRCGARLRIQVIEADWIAWCAVLGIEPDDITWDRPDADGQRIFEGEASLGGVPLMLTMVAERKAVA